MNEVHPSSQKCANVSSPSHLSKPKYSNADKKARASTKIRQCRVNILKLKLQAQPFNEAKNITAFESLSVMTQPGNKVRDSAESASSSVMGQAINEMKANTEAASVNVMAQTSTEIKGSTALKVMAQTFDEVKDSIESASSSVMEQTSNEVKDCTQSASFSVMAQRTNKIKDSTELPFLEDMVPGTETKRFTRLAKKIHENLLKFEFIDYEMPTHEEVAKGNNYADPIKVKAKRGRKRKGEETKAQLQPKKRRASKKQEAQTGNAAAPKRVRKPRKKKIIPVFSYKVLSDFSVVRYIDVINDRGVQASYSEFYPVDSTEKMVYPDMPDLDMPETAAQQVCVNSSLPAENESNQLESLPDVSISSNEDGVQNNTWECDISFSGQQQAQNIQDTHVAFALAPKDASASSQFLSLLEMEAQLDDALDFEVEETSASAKPTLSKSYSKKDDYQDTDDDESILYNHIVPPSPINLEPESLWEPFGEIQLPPDYQISYPEILDLFGIKCLQFLADNCTLSHSHMLNNRKYVEKSLLCLSLTNINMVYKYAYRNKLLFIRYFETFCEAYAKHNHVKKLLHMASWDIGKYMGEAHLIHYVFKALRKCGMPRTDVCRRLICECKHCSPEVIDALFITIMDENLMGAVNEIAHIFESPNMTLPLNVLLRMTTATLNRPDKQMEYCILKALQNGGVSYKKLFMAISSKEILLKESSTKGFIRELHHVLKNSNNFPIRE